LTLSVILSACPIQEDSAAATGTCVGSHALVAGASVLSIPALWTSRALRRFIAAVFLIGSMTTVLSVPTQAQVPSTLTPVSGSGQSTTVDTFFANPLKVIVQDSGGNTLPNVNITFTAPAGPISSTATAVFNGSSNVITVMSDGTGTATVPAALVKASQKSAQFSVDVSAGPASTTISLINAPGPAATISVSQGAGQQGTISTTLPLSFVALVVDRFGNPAPGVGVTFTAPSSGASGSFSGSLTSLTTTNASGLATAASFAFNTTAGVFNVVANTTASALGVPTNFNLISIPGAATQISVSQGSGQSTQILTTFGTVLQAIVRDAANNPVSNVDVTFTAPSSGASATFAGGLTTYTVATNASGVAIATALTANSTTGIFNIAATFSGGPSINFAMTNTPGAATTMVVNAGDGQSATITLSFTTSLSVIVKDAGGNVVPGAVVTFSAPGSGASGLFGASTTTTATTNASGIATAATFKANAIAGTYTITVTYLSLTTTFTLNNINPSAIAMNAGGGQTATIMTAFGTALSARVTNSSGAGIPGLTVTFTAPGSGASGTFGGSASTTAITDGSGIATASAFTANGTAGGYNVNATVAGVGSPASFALTNNNPAAIAVQAGDGQQATIGTAYPTLMSAKVTDGVGAAVAGLTVTFTAPGSGASGNFGGPLTKTAVTNASGIATATAFTANATVGAFAVNATVTGLVTPAVFNLTNLTPTPFSVTASPAGSTPQNIAINSVFGTALGVVVKDVNGIVLNNIPVTFTVNAVGGAGATFAGSLTTWSGNTNASGIVTAAALTANGTAGTYTVTATAGSITFTFNLTNRAAASIAATGGTPQTTLISTNFASQLQVTVLDGSSNPVSGAIVTFTVPGSGASSTLSSTTATTNASGIASVTATANATFGSYTVTAAVAGVASTANFSLTNNAPNSITASAGATQSAVINTNFGVLLQATVLDISNNPVVGATVTFTAPGSAASGKFGASLTKTAVTNGSGVATATAFTAGGTAGSYVVAASVSGVATTADYNLTNVLATPVTAVASPANGTPQSTAISTAFANLLGVLVKDSGGAVIAGLPVTFTVNPVGGASGSFSGGSSETVTTNASGIATASTFTANGVAGTYTVTATVGSLTVTFTLSNTAAPAAIAATAGNNQSAVISTNFTNALQAKVTDAGGAAISGAVVVFTAPTTGARATFGGSSSATAVTNASGIATATAALAGTVTGSYTITATVQGTAVSTTFTLTNTPGAAATIARVTGSGQSAELGADYALVLVAVVKDASNNVIPGASVTFNAPTVGARATFAGGLASVTVVTDSSGNATSTVLTAVGAAGGVSVNAKVNNTTPVTAPNFSLTNTAGVPGSVAAQSGGSQTTIVNTNFGSTLQALVKDTLGNPVSGVTVTFTTPGSGASGGFGGSTTATATTNASGIATSPTLKANTTSGTFFAQATISGVASPAVYTLTNTPDSPVAISIVQGTPQSTIVSTAFATQLVAQVKDVYGNAVPGASVTFLAPTVGSIGTFTGPTNTATVTSDTNGRATAPTITANAIAGTYTVSASIPAGAFVNYNLTNNPAPASILVSGGSTQTTPVTTAFGTTLQVTVRDTSNLPVPGAVVTFVVPSSGASSTLSSLTATTNASGVATVTATANATAGSYAVTATVAGVATPVTFNLTNTAGAASALSVTGGNTQTTLVTTAFGTALQATVKDASNNPVAGIVVTFVVPSSGASATLSSLTATTNASGVASVTATANATPGAYSVTATAAGIATPVSFGLTNTVGVPSSISASGGVTQSTPVTTAFGTALQVTVRDGSNNPVPGVVVTFVAPSSGATSTLSAGTATTNASGVASVTATANGTAGTYLVSATVAGVATTLKFTLTNTAGAPSSIVATGGVTQSTLISTSFGTALQVTVKDGAGNPVSGVTVTFAAPTAGASSTLSSTTATTNAAGVASVTATANGTTGTYQITATVAGIATPITFTLTNTGTPGLQLTVTGAPSLISAPGQTVTFSYVVRNTGNVAVSGAAVADRKVTGITCPATTLAVNASMTCTGTYVSTAADILNRGIVSVAQATGTSVAGAAASASVTTNVGIDVEAIRRKTVDANKEFMMNRARALTSMAPNAQRLQHRLSDSIFGNSEEEEPAPAPERGRHDTLKAFDTPGAMGGSDSRQSPFGGRSGPMFGSQQPTIMGSNLRPESSLPGGAEYSGMLVEGTRSTTASPFTVGGDADDRNGRLNFSASLSQMRSAALAQETAKLNAAGQPDATSGQGAKRKGGDKFDIWVEGQSSYYTNDGIDGRRKGRASVLYAGSDVVVAPGVIVGALYQRDWLRESATTLGQNRDGAGWMAGPYIGMRLTKSIYFDARYAWGTATNNVDPLGAYTDTFSTARKLASARLTGDWTRGAWRFRPSADLTYFTEVQKSYVNQIGIDIPESRISLGRVTFGPEIGYRMQLPNQMVLEPYVGLKGVWDFVKSKDVRASGVALAPDVFTGRVELGASLKTESGVSFRAVGAYDGLGTSNYRAWQGQVFVVVPIK